MNYVIEITIVEDTDEVTKQRIKKNLHNGETLQLPLFPKIGMPIGLKDKSYTKVQNVLPLQKIQGGSDAIALVKPLESSSLL